MLIQSMTRKASNELLARAKVGRLACAHEGQPYITPMSFIYEADCLYSFSTVGQKIAWMRANPLVCVETEELVDRQNWATVIVFGRYEELPKTPSDSNRTLAYDLLQRRPMWWEPGYAKTVIDGKERPLEGVYFRIHVSKITGHRTLPDTDPRVGG
jgi:nitroimidazol reductase NimA-like FMN-containing flavoprotein (pyridoxamine 5'-phosphate oxidase superfamily)